MNTHTNAHTPPTVAEAGDRYTESGMRVPAAEVRAREVAGQAGRWLAFATERTRMRPHMLTAKALSSVAFSVHQGAASLAVPSKLAGTSAHQPALWALVRNPAGPWAALDVEATADGLLASYDGTPLGAVQTKHVGWVRPLLAFGLTVHLGRVTGHDYEYTLGLNVAFGHVGAALDRLLDALGTDGGPGGDGAPGGPVLAASGGPQPEVSDGGGAAPMAAQGPVRAPVSPPPTAPLRLVVRPEHDTLRPGHDPDDVVLYRRLDGTAVATVAHAVRHSPDGIEWGYGGAGPADLARSVLLALTDRVTADALSQRFKTEVVVRVPYAGGVLRAADVRAWAAAQADRPPAA